MRILLIVGLILLVAGIVLFFVPIPHQQRHGFDAGPVSVGVTTTEHEKVPVAVSAGLVVIGAVLMIAGGRKAA
jgi:uncharacterized membrane protein